jgi:hypothetical protein
MAASTPGRISATPPLTQPTAPSKSCPRKPSAKVLEVQRSLRTRSRSTRNEPLLGSIAVPEREGHEIPEREGCKIPECEGREASLEEVALLITNLKDIITQQNSVINSIQADLAEIKAEQQSLKNQNAELQEEIRSFRQQLTTSSAPVPLTQSWAAVTARGDVSGLEPNLSQATNSQTPNTELNCQLVIDVGQVREEELERVVTTEAAKQTITQGMKEVEGLTGAVLKDFQVWRTNNSTNIIKFSVEQDKEPMFRQTTAQWLEPHISGARLIGPKWYAVKADWIEVPLAMDIDSGKVSKSAMERFGIENGVEVCTMRWLGKTRPSGQHASVVIKVSTKVDAERLLRTGSATFRGGAVIVSPFEERRTPIACFKCRRFGHKARDCIQQETCNMCGQEGHLQCETIKLHCVNCQGPHQASHRECPEYRKEKDRILAHQRHE